MAGKSHDALSNIANSTQRGGAKLAWTRPCVQRMHAGAAEEGANSVTDFGLSKS